MQSQEETEVPMAVLLQRDAGYHARLDAMLDGDHSYDEICCAFNRSYMEVDSVFRAEVKVRVVFR